MTRELKIPLSSPDITGEEIEAVVRVLKTPQLSLGPKLTEFEESFADYLGVPCAVAVNSGTSGLHLAVKSLGIGADDAVLTTPFSFISSANCILYEKALPLFVDIDPQSLNISPEKVEAFLASECRRSGSGTVVHLASGRVVKAILPVHVFGNPCRMDRIMEVARRYGLFVIEDACEAIGAEYRGAKAGSIGDLGVFAFYPNKQMTTGEGGMIVTRDRAIAEYCRSLRNQGRDSGAGWLAHRWLGYNYRLSDINCALGIAQLSRIEEILARRDAVAQLYSALLSDVVAVPSTEPGGRRSWFVYVVQLEDGRGRDALLAELTRRGIGCSNYFPPIHLQPCYRESYGYRPGDFPVTEAVSARTVALPFYNALTADEVRHVAAALRDAVAGRLPAAAGRRPGAGRAAAAVSRHQGGEA